MKKKLSGEFSHVAVLKQMQTRPTDEIQDFLVAHFVNSSEKGYGNPLTYPRIIKELTHEYNRQHHDEEGRKALLEAKQAIEEEYKRNPHLSMADCYLPVG